MTILNTRWKHLLGPALALFALSACDSSSSDGDGNKDAGKDASDEEDASDHEHDAAEPEEDASDELDGGADSGADGSVSDSGADGSVTFAKINDDTKVSTAITAAGHEHYYAVTHDKDGNIFAVGQASPTNKPYGGSAEDKSDYSIVLVKYKPNGELDMAFGDKGVAQKNVVAAEITGGSSREVARGVVVQSTGKIVVGATVPHAAPAEDAGVERNDTDYALLRFNADGKPDTTFGTDGVKVLDVTTPFVYQPPTPPDAGMAPAPALASADQQYHLALGAEDKLVVFGVSLAEGMKAAAPTEKRTDNDWTVLRLTKDGEYDNGFDSDGKQTLDIAEGNGSARAVTVLKDGSVVAAGYASVAGELDTTTMNRQQPVLFKLKNDGTFDADFAKDDKYSKKPGVFYDFVTPMNTNAEAYGAVLQGDKFITLGYGVGPATNNTSDFIYARFNADGSQDKTWGDNGKGTTYVDFGGFGDNGRALVVLDDKRIVGVGGGRAKVEPPPATASSVPVEGAVSVLLPDGKPDPDFGTNGQKLYNIGGAGDFYWGANLAPDKKSVAIVGIAGAADAAGNDNGALLILKLQ
jgi:uncharacterized delta-60 repeat protein